MTPYTLNQYERAMSGFTHVFKLGIADMATLVNGTKITLCPLAVGDIVWPAKLLQEVRTLVTGPTGTPTASVGITAAVTQFTAATSIISGTQQVVPTSAAPYVVATGTNLVVDFEAGGGNGAAATAGEIWVWVSLSLIADRNTLKG